jgi:hypothetical protein
MTTTTTRNAELNQLNNDKHKTARRLRLTVGLASGLPSRLLSHLFGPTDHFWAARFGLGLPVVLNLAFVLGRPFCVPSHAGVEVLLKT